MTGQKGVDLLRDALDAVMRLDLQLVMLASGDAVLEKFFKDAEKRYPQKLRTIIEFNNTTAHRIQAGSDAFLMPSRFEPCGLTQMYALRYGTAPVVRATGGLRDTVREFDPARGTGNGFVFEKFDASEMVAALDRMVDDVPRSREVADADGKLLRVGFLVGSCGASIRRMVHAAAKRSRPQLEFRSVAPVVSRISRLCRRLMPR